MSDDDGAIYRSAVDPRVWICNIPETDVASGVQASTSLRTLKAYVEEVQARHNIAAGSWVQVSAGYWEYHGTD